MLYLGGAPITFSFMNDKIKNNINYVPIISFQYIKMFAFLLIKVTFQKEVSVFFFKISL